MTVLTSKMVDRLAALNDVIKAAEAEAKAIKKLMIDGGAVSYEGSAFVATVTAYTTDRLDMEAVRAHLSVQFITAHTVTTQAFRVTVKPVVKIAA